MADRRFGNDRRERADRRTKIVVVGLERRSGKARRKGKDRRSDRDRRVFWDKRSPMQRRRIKRRKVNIPIIPDLRIRQGKA